MIVSGRTDAWPPPSAGRWMLRPRMRVRAGGKIGNGLVNGYVTLHGTLDGVFCDFAHHHIWVASAEAGEERKKRDLKGRGRVRVHSKIGFNEDDAAIDVQAPRCERQA